MVVDKNKDLEKTDLEFHLNKWRAFRTLLVDFDGWHIDHIPVGDVKEDNVPVDVMSFVVVLGEQYVLNQLSPKQVAVLRSIL